MQIPLKPRGMGRGVARLARVKRRPPPGGGGRPCAEVGEHGAGHVCERPARPIRTPSSGDGVADMPMCLWSGKGVSGWGVVGAGAVGAHATCVV